MKFPRNARILKGQLDAAPFATVFFLLVLFLMLGSLVYTPGVRLQLPMADNLPGTDWPTVSVAIDADGRLYFENQIIETNQLLARLGAARASAGSVALVVQADRTVSYDKLVQLTLLARKAGIGEAWLATLPQPLAPMP